MSDGKKQRSHALVAKVLNDFKVIINIGSLNEVQAGQTFLVYTIGEEIFDPLTKESLGKVDVIRGRGRIVYVQEKISHLESIETKVQRRTRAAYLSAMNSGDEITDEPFDGVKEGDFCRPI